MFLALAGAIAFILVKESNLPESRASASPPPAETR
jgi:hypothetical protein